MRELIQDCVSKREKKKEEKKVESAWLAEMT